MVPDDGKSLREYTTRTCVDQGKIKYLEYDDAVAVHHHVVENSGGAFGVRDEALLISALQRPKNLTYYDSNADIFELAATLLTGIAMNHPFLDGNKRCAMMCALIFLSMNGIKLKTLEISRSSKLIIGVATHKISDAQVADFLKKLADSK
ncbi:MAG: type II toxin-antitoxin system death-on-curing family toxin, partial [Puniceicoccales bacterium]|nr:type II toxin-antitoxin system death-on-curing family toxin [Puniceicoccales bacterium]